MVIILSFVYFLRACCKKTRTAKPMAEGGTSVDPVVKGGDREEIQFHDLPDQYEAAPLAMRLNIQKVTGGEVEWLTESQLLSFIREKMGTLPIAVTIMDRTRSIVEWPKDTPIVLTSQKLHGDHLYNGEKVSVSCLMAQKSYLNSTFTERDELERRKEELKREQELHRESVLQLLEQVNSQIQNLNALQENLPSASQSVVGSYQTKLINRPPMLPRFSGLDPTPKDECPFEQWYFQVSAVRTLYTEAAMKTALLTSVVGEAGEYLVFIGLDLELDDILSKFQRRYGKKSNADALFREYFQIQQQKGEKVQGLAHRLERSFRRLNDEIPGVVTEDSLKERLFYGMTQRLRDSMRFHYEKEESTYDSLLEASRRVETEIVEPKTVVVRAATVETKKNKKGKKDPKEVQTKIDELMAQLKSANFTYSKKREKRSQTKKGGPKKENNQKPESPETHTEQETDLEEVKRKGKITCFRCRGRGHMAKGCSTPVEVAENINWGGSTGTQSSPEGGKGPGSQ